MLTAASAFRPIDTDYSGWEQDLWDRVRQYAEQSPYFRTTTYYFSSDGDDSNDGLHPLSPKQTITAAQALLDASGTTPIRLSFQRGDMWDTTVGIDCTRDHTTIGAHGEGERPFFNFFTEKYTAGWGVHSGNCYLRDETSDIAWVRLQNDRFGIHSGTPLSRQDSAANCVSTNWSWYYDGAATLYVNLAGASPNSVPLEAVISNEKHGISIAADGCRVQSMRVDGAGMHSSIEATQEQPFTDLSSGNQSNLFVDCQGNFSGSHVIAHFLASGSGGRSCFIGCEANYAKFNTSGGETLFNSYSQQGDHETLFLYCNSRHGTLPSSDWTFASEYSRGSFVYAHVDIATYPSAECELHVVYKGEMFVTIFPPISIGSLNDLATYTPGDPTTAKAFMVKNYQPYTSAITVGGIPFRDGTVLYGCTLRYNAPSGVLSLDSATGGNFMAFNCDIEVDLANRGDNTWGFLNHATNNNDIELINNRFHIKNATGTTADRYGFSVLNRNATGVGGTGVLDEALAFNNIFSTDSVDADAYYLGFRNEAAGLKNNAYFGLVQAAGEERGWDADTGAVVPSSVPLVGLVHPDLLAAGDATRLLSHDMDGRRRIVAAPDIGPIDASSKSFIEPQAGLDILEGILDPGVENFNWPTMIASINTATAPLAAASAEPTGVPAANETVVDKIGYLFAALRNKITVTATKKQFYNDSDAALWEKDLTDDETTYTETKGNAP